VEEVMTTILLLVAAAALFAVVAGGRLLRSDRRDDVERFNRARALTTTWAEQYRPGEPPMAYPREGEHDAAQDAEARKRER
jgi:hypothetical protein